VLGPYLNILINGQYPSSCVASMGDYYSATISLKAVPGWTFYEQPDAVIAHEYGHAWTLHAYFVLHAQDWSSYLDFRGLTGNPLLDSSYNWSVEEIIADDYRLLFGSDLAISERPRHLNPYISDPRDVPGLADFLTTWFR
jgi:hypothetical protein